jgi:hypothetical protein
MQLSGYTCHDRILTSANTIAGLVSALDKAPAPAKLADVETVRALDAALPNVTVYTRKRTRRHADEAIGRGKLVQEALGLEGLLDIAQARRARKEMMLERSQEAWQKRLETRKTASPEEKEALQAKAKEARKAKALATLRLVSDRPGTATASKARTATAVAASRVHLEKNEERAAALREVKRLQSRRKLAMSRNGPKWVAQRRRAEGALRELQRKGIAVN